MKVYYTPYKMSENSGDFKQYEEFMNYANHDKIDLQHFYVCLLLFFYIFLHIQKFLKAH